MERLFDQKESQHSLGGLRISRPQALICHELAISGKKRGGRAIAPFRERRGELALLVGRQLERALPRRGGRIVGRANQGCDIARRGRLARCVGKRSYWV